MTKRISRRQLLRGATLAGVGLALSTCFPFEDDQTPPAAADSATPTLGPMPADTPTAMPTDPARPTHTAETSETLTHAPTTDTPTATSTHTPPSTATPEPTATPVPTRPPASETPAAQPMADETPTNTAYLPQVTRAPATRSPHTALLIDHNCTDVTAIPQEWIEEAKRTLHIGYGHTSHGSQLTTGMTGLVDFANDGGLGLSLPQGFFSWNEGGIGGALDLREFIPKDAGYYPLWVDRTKEYLGSPDPGTGRGTNNREVNVIIWSWCGQVSTYAEQQMLDTYLLPMARLEQDYPGVAFVYMTGHADGTGEGGNLHLRNQQIRAYCVQNQKVLYDFYDIELYDPDGSYYGDKAVTDSCDYDSNGDGRLDANWARAWQESHTRGVEWYGGACAHSEALNCNQKAYAAWWLWARLAGWDGT